MEKPHKGRIEHWTKVSYSNGDIVCGRALDHPAFAGHNIHTSYVLKHDKATGEIETRNSRYTLIGPPIK